MESAAFQMSSDEMCSSIIYWGIVDAHRNPSSGSHNPPLAVLMNWTLEEIVNLID
jgi:hypothetical protein